MVRLEDLLPFIERKIQEDAAQQEDELREAGILFFFKMIFGLGKKNSTGCPFTGGQYLEILQGDSVE